MAWAAAAGSGWPKMALPATNTDAPGGGGERGGADIDPTVDFDGHGQAAAVDLLAGPADLRHDLGA